jgi:hypothetical protein
MPRALSRFVAPGPNAVLCKCRFGEIAAPTSWHMCRWSGALKPEKLDPSRRQGTMYGLKRCWVPQERRSICWEQAAVVH